MGGFKGSAQFLGEPMSVGRRSEEAVDDRAAVDGGAAADDSPALG
jgi:hypothetical protein